MAETPVTRLLNGEAADSGRLLEVVYDQLRGIAQQRMAHERRDHTLQATALVHEAYLRLVGDAEVSWANRAHFFAAAAEAMRRILVDSARRKQAVKHGGGLRQVDADVADRGGASSQVDLLALDEALSRFALLDPQKAELVKLRYFAGMTMAEAAAALGISLATAERHWTYARTWLFAELNR